MRKSKERDNEKEMKRYSDQLLTVPRREVDGHERVLLRPRDENPHVLVRVDRDVLALRVDGALGVPVGLVGVGTAPSPSAPTPAAASATAAVPSSSSSSSSSASSAGCGRREKEGRFGGRCYRGGKE